MVGILVCSADTLSARKDKVVTPPITLRNARRLMQVLLRRARKIYFKHAHHASWREVAGETNHFSMRTDEARCAASGAALLLGGVRALSTHHPSRRFFDRLD